jgi:hypothetical protein
MNIFTLAIGKESEALYTSWAVIGEVMWLELNRTDVFAARYVVGKYEKVVTFIVA